MWLSEWRPLSVPTLRNPCLVWLLAVSERLLMGKSPHTFLDPGGGPFKYKYFKSEITDRKTFNFPPLTEFRTRGSATPKPILSSCLLRSPKSFPGSPMLRDCHSFLQDTPALSALWKSTELLLSISLVGFYVAAGPLVPIKVSSSIKCPVLVLHSTCLQLNHAVGSPSTHPDCLCFMRPDHNGVLLSLW